MTDYVYHNSEGRYYDMKDKNQEGQIGLLKVELMKMTTILKEKVNLLQNEKIFLNNTISDWDTPPHESNECEIQDVIRQK